MAELGDGEHQQEGHEGDHVEHPQRLVDPRRRRLGHQGTQRVADERPDLEVGSAGEGDPGRLDGESAEPDQRQGEQDEAVLGACLGPDPPRPGSVPAQRRPGQPAEVDKGEQVQHERVALVEPALEELQVVGEDVVDLEGHRPGEQHQEAEVDGAVHETGARVAEQGAHRQPAAQLVEPPLEHAAPVVGGSPLPVAGTVGEQQHRDERRGGDHDVEDGHHQLGDVAEYDTADLRHLDLGKRAQPPRGQDPDRDHHSEADHGPPHPGPGAGRRRIVDVWSLGGGGGQGPSSGDAGRV